jgi:hypothetical protein
VETYRLISIDRTAAPNGDAGDDWLVYRIAQGNSTVTGYRRGTLQSVGTEIERMVNSVNERLLVRARR